MIEKTVCKRIAYYRQKRNLTQEELAAKAGLRLERLINIESGSKTPRINELAQLAVCLGISIHELLNKEVSR
ncbi:helix-turn-helix domain-containing protein [Desulfosporosinus sp. SB140]|uniref:helix-turn-helix domain-containing protein n=1 Tax=Desulfosporosinus paludis TaxID=3115649 RepID=UPI00388FFA5C